MNAADTAHQVLADAANAEFNALCARAEAAGCRWVWDPEVDNVVGLVKPGTRKSALVVVYVADDDFEADDLRMEDYVAELEASPPCT